MNNPKIKNQCPNIGDAFYKLPYNENKAMV